MAEAGETRNSELFEEVWDKASAKVDEITKNEDERKFLKSLVMGGTVAGEIVVGGAEGVRKLWGEGNLAWAQEVTQLFSFLMLSQCYHWVSAAQQGQGEQKPQNISLVPKEVSATKLIYLFGGEPEAGIEEFMNFDQQFNYDLEKKPHIVHTSTLILAQICEITGHNCVDWKKVKWPVVELTHLMAKGILKDTVPLRGQDDINLVTNALYTGEQAMTKFHEGG
jgi:hypothetical protein